MFRWSESLFHLHQSQVESQNTKIERSVARRVSGTPPVVGKGSTPEDIFMSARETREDLKCIPVLLFIYISIRFESNMD